MTDSLNNAVKFIEIIKCEGMTPKSAVMAPKLLLQRIAVGGDVSDDEMLQCVVIKDFE